MKEKGRIGRFPSSFMKKKTACIDEERGESQRGTRAQEKRKGGGPKGRGGESVGRPVLPRMMGKPFRGRRKGILE